MKKILLFGFSLVLILSSIVKGVQIIKSPSIPNIIIILTDDQGTIDVNCFGAKDLHTPNMDKLAETGIMFTQFYAAAAVCSPSRAALMTGNTPLKAGLPGNASSMKGKHGMNTGNVTIAEKLKEKGYVTAHIGKWHLGYSPETMPNGQGFDYSFGHMGGCIDNYSHFFYWHGPNRHDLWENGKEVWEDGKYFQDLMAAKVEEFLEENVNNKFFLYYAINLPHYPLQGTDKWREFYSGLDSPRDKYAAAVSSVDERIGLLLDQLDELNLRDSTIIIFQSDHGHSMEERTFGGGGNSGIYRGAKFSLFEGGIRVPSIISWPGIIPENEKRDQMSISMDWFPTILDLSDINYDPNEYEGKSLKKVIFDNESSPHEALRWFKNEDIWAVRKGNWKLLKNPEDPSKKAPILERDSLFLVNLENDPGEIKNMHSNYLEKTNELISIFNNWYNDINKKGD